MPGVTLLSRATWETCTDCPGLPRNWKLGLDQRKDTVSGDSRERMWRHALDPSRGRWSCLVAKWCLTFCSPMDWGQLGSSVRGIPQSRILKWVAISFSKGSSPPRDWTRISCVPGGLFTAEPLREHTEEVGKKVRSGLGNIFQRCWGTNLITQQCCIHFPAGRWDNDRPSGWACGWTGSLWT